MSHDEDSADTGTLIEMQPKLAERFRHVFGVHSWHRLDGPGPTREYCPGCRQERRPVGGFRRPPETAPPPQTEETPTPDAASEPEPETIPFPQRDQPRFGEPRRRPGQESDDDLERVWEWVVGLPIWAKIVAGFVVIQVLATVVSLFTR
jgi:hypothetical protein